nr:type II secretion system F family protein [Capillibacterium thermochitinicola]
MIPIEVREVKRSNYGRFLKKGGNKQDLFLFTRQLAGLLASGITLDKAMEIVVNLLQNNPLGRVIRTVHQQMKAGVSLSRAMEDHNLFFDSLYVSLVRVGENTGLLPQIMGRLAQTMEEELNLRRQILSSLTYPLMVFIASIAATIFLLLKVVPQFEALFTQSGSDLPRITRIVLGLSKNLQTIGLILAVTVGLLLLLLIFYFSTEQGRRLRDRLLLNLPVTGGLQMRFILADFARTLSLLLKSGVPLLESLSLLKTTISNVIVADLIGTAEEEVRKGGSFARFLSRQTVLPSLVGEMFGVGEEAGTLDEMAAHLARFYETEAKQKLNALVSLLGPVLIILLTGLIFLIAIAVLLPIISLNIGY